MFAPSANVDIPTDFTAMDFYIGDPEYLRKHYTDIIRVASFHQADYDRAVIRKNPDDYNRLRESLNQPNRAPTTGLGSLDTLHLELLYEVFDLLDMRTLFRFRQVNLCALEFVTSTRVYQVIMNHALEAFCVCLQTQIAPWYTLRDLFKVLCTRDCVLCGAFGGFIFLPTFTRCCLSCVDKAPQLRALHLASALKTHIHSTATRVQRSVPVLRAMPGKYSMGGVFRKKRALILAEVDVMRSPGARGQQCQSPHENLQVRLLRCMATTALPYFNKERGDSENGISCLGCQIPVAREMARMVYSASGSPDDGELLRILPRDRVYSRDGFMEHFQECLEAQAAWGVSKEGTIPVKIPILSRHKFCHVCVLFGMQEWDKQLGKDHIPIPVDFGPLDLDDILSPSIFSD